MTRLLSFMARGAAQVEYCLQISAAAGAAFRFCSVHQGSPVVFVYHFFHGAFPLSQSFCSRLLSLSVSMHCQKEAWVYAMSWPSLARPSSGSFSNCVSAPPDGGR